MRELDFIIIGAQKSGTTTLWKLLDEHPDVFVPAGKEIAFFNKDPYDADAYGAYVREHFGRASSDQIIGKATPHYLNDPMAASRIEEKLPNCKLIVILRDPAERTLSHFRMSLRRELETRHFEEMIHQELQPQALEAARTMRTGETSESHTYIAWSEYGRLLSAYQSYHNKGQLLILFTSDLEDNPLATMEKLLKFVGLPMAHLPSLGQKIHQGGDRQKIPVLKYLKKVPGVRSVWGLIPARFRKQLLFSFNQWNISQSSDSIEKYDESTISQLRNHFTEDESVLSEFVGGPAHWASQVK